MKALVLTYDPQFDLADLLVRSYDRLLIDPLFEFRVPVNAPRERGCFGGGQRVSFITCAPDIPSTMAALLQDIPDREWVFWAIDDRFPSWLDRAAFVATFRTIRQGGFDHANGVKLIRWRERLTDVEFRLPCRSFKLQQPGEFFGFYHHQFLRAGLLRRYFVDSALDGVEGTLYGLHDHFRQAGKVDFLKDIYVPVSGNIVHFDEPLVGGALTRNGVKALKQYGCAIPAYPVKDVSLGFHDVERQMMENPGKANRLKDKDL